MGSISAANAEFCFDLFRELKPQHINENIFYSPLSIISALAMVYLGTRGNTALQVEKVLHFDEFRGLEGPSKTEQYLKRTNKLYQAGLESVDFKNAPEESRRIINSWVENQTNGLIKDLFGTGSIDTFTALVLVNVIYFKGKWNKGFEEENTKEMPFRINQQETKPVQMMHQAGFFKIASIGSEKIHILELPYANEELSMIILLPNDISDLDQLENTINFDKLMAWTSSTNMRKRKVEVYLPRMKLEEQYSLAPVLSSLGMTDLFTQSADLSGISTGKNLAVSEVIHKSHVEINEEGTEAAAATGVTIVLMSHVFPIKFKADHPFLFFIHHKKTNLILFYGRFSSP
ncbi:PREDICTED: ovalbumin-like isoform X2 [Crocodylus porosus]|uniref:ovalbumin-like isoform X2 n=1 Tax=Crocodylus porosus TaxID=8502 RepID=UPI00093B9DE3|nr:PREDICTED: ovalbumin-like isoform X2 [Crocodylus porosus]